MKTRTISPKLHALIDYALVGTLLTFPTLLKMNGTAKKMPSLV